MRELYIDCNMGAAGDMLTAALYELLDEEQRKEFLDTMVALTPEGIEVSVRPETKCGILGSHFDVVINGEEECSEDIGHAHKHSHEFSHEHEHAHDHEHMHERAHTHEHEHTHAHEHCHEHAHDHEHIHEHTHEHAHDHEHMHTHEHAHPHEHEHDHDHDHTHAHSHVHEHTHAHTHTHTHANEHTHVHHGMADVEAIVNGFGGISDAVKANIMKVYGIIADAESEVHGTTVTEIHFHEVGMMDAIVDVTAVCLLMDMLAPDKVTASPVRVGWGHMRCAHGILPVPAPATANILRGVPTYAGGIKAELCTPTGAALLKYFAEDFTEQPLMQVSRIGYGMGTKDFEVCNCVRALLAE